MLFRISFIGETLKQGFGSGRMVGMFIDEQIGLDISTSIKQRTWLLKNDTKSTLSYPVDETESKDYGNAYSLCL